jgi:hypothetical protein
MLGWDDERWNSLKGGYRRPSDPRPLLRRLEYGTDLKASGMNSGGNSIIKAKSETHPTLVFRILCAFIDNAEFRTGIHTPSLPVLSCTAEKGTTPSCLAG